jgi:F-type H+-transporting ATPase subunit b
LTVRKRFFSRIFRFVVLAVLAAFLAVAPSRLTAQGTASMGKSQPTAQAPVSQSQAKPDAANPETAPSSDQNEEDVYLHSPMVRTIARILHLSLATAVRIFLGINFVIIVLAIGIPLFRFLPKHLRNRAQKLREDIESARKTTEDANSRLSAVEAKLSSIGEEIEKFRAEVERESLADEAHIKSTLKEESERILSAAEQEIAAAATQARRGLRNFAADLAVDRAAKQLVLTPENDRALIAEFVGDVTGKGKS